MLLVEDDQVTGAALATILRRRGYTVTLVATVAEGLKKLVEKPKYVVLDLMLPDGDGSSVLQHIRHNALPIRVVVTTAVSDPQRLRDICNMQPDLLLQKPIDLGRLLDSMKPQN